MQTIILVIFLGLGLFLIIFPQKSFGVMSGLRNKKTQERYKNQIGFSRVFGLVIFFLTIVIIVKSVR